MPILKNLDPAALPDNFIRLIGRQWMLITAGNSAGFNTMTASWGSIGFLWNKPVAQIFVRPERYTFEFIEAEPCFTLSFLREEFREVHKVTGSLSGRDADKIALTGLHPLYTESGNVCFEEAELVLECKKLYTDELKPENFLQPGLAGRWYGEPHGNFHKIYLAEILHAWKPE